MQLSFTDLVVKGLASVAEHMKLEMTLGICRTILTLNFAAYHEPPYGANEWKQMRFMDRVGLLLLFIDVSKIGLADKYNYCKK